MRRRYPEPAGTIDPARLQLSPSGRILACTALSPTIPTPSPPLPVPPVPRICSDFSSENDIARSRQQRQRDNKRNFDQFREPGTYPPQNKKKKSTTWGQAHFLRQTQEHLASRITVDPEAGPGAIVFVEPSAFTIYDIYLLQVDIATNKNNFSRIQTVFFSATQLYKVIVRTGRVGLLGSSHSLIETDKLSLARDKFRRAFRDRVGWAWSQRYDRERTMGQYALRCYSRFVELDYCRDVARPKELPDYTPVSGEIHEDVMGLVRLMLWGPQSDMKTKNEEKKEETYSNPYSAPYELLSQWSLFCAFEVLQDILRHLESGQPINWKSIVQASSFYRNHIPFCAGQHGRVPEISSYHALFLELRLLFTLLPHQQIGTVMNRVSAKASLQLQAYRNLARPLYQAYSSLRHGFRRLTDRSSLEFREIKAYLDGSSMPGHGIHYELQEIYRVFVKSGLPNPYEDFMEKKRGNDHAGGEHRVLLWHGTPHSCVLGILDTGLTIQRKGAPTSGAMFGKGIYLADASSKSAGYCKYTDRDNVHGDAILLLCEADIGKNRLEVVTSNPEGHMAIKASGGHYRSMVGLGRTMPAKWKMVLFDVRTGRGIDYIERPIYMPDTRIKYMQRWDQPPLGSLLYNEYVIYDETHVTVRYGLHVRIKSAYHRF